MSDTIKQDLNFMDKYLWLPVQRDPSKEGVVVVDEEGYTYRAGYKAPEKFDMLVFLYALMKSQQAGYEEEMEFTRYEILKACGCSLNNLYYNRLEDCLRRWMNVTVEFKGTFYDGKEYLFMAFHLVEKAIIDKKTKKVKIVFGKDFLTTIKESKFFKYVYFDFYKALKRPVTRRLFEIIFPKFYYNKAWNIGLVKLAKKIGLPGEQVKTKNGYVTRYYQSHVLRTILPCIRELNTLSGDKRKLKSLGLDEFHTFLVEYELFTNSQGEKSIRLLKKEVAPAPVEELEEQDLPERIRGLVSLEYIKKQWENAITWLDDLTEFESRRLKEVKNFPKHVVALIFDRVKWKYDHGKIKTMGGIYKAFKLGWYLQDVILNLEDKKRKREKEREKQECKEGFERIQKVLGKNKADESWKSFGEELHKDDHQPKSVGDILKGN